MNVYDIYVERVTGGWCVSQAGETVSHFLDDAEDDPLWSACRLASRLARRDGARAWLVQEGSRQRISDE